jgi:hypothetical protein
LRKLYDLDEENMSLRVLFSEYEVKKYLTTGSTTYNYKGYKQLIEDMKQACVALGTIPQEPIIKGITPSNIWCKKTRGNLPAVKGKELPYMIVEFGSVISYLIIKELRFTYDPKPIIQLQNGISQAVVRFLKTHKNHPASGYHLRPLMESIEGNEIENKRWWKIREHLKEDIELLKNLGITIDFKKDRLFVAC